MTKQNDVEECFKISSLKGSRNLIRIECKCGAIWKRGKDKRDQQAKLRFIREHGEHLIKSFVATSKVYVS